MTRWHLWYDSSFFKRSVTPWELKRFKRLVTNPTKVRSLKFLSAHSIIINNHVPCRRSYYAYSYIHEKFPSKNLVPKELILYLCSIVRNYLFYSNPRIKCQYCL